MVRQPGMPCCRIHRGLSDPCDRCIMNMDAGCLFWGTGTCSKPFGKEAGSGSPKGMAEGTEKKRQRFILSGWSGRGEGGYRSFGGNPPVYHHREGTTKPGGNVWYRTCDKWICMFS